MTPRVTHVTQALNHVLRVHDDLVDIITEDLNINKHNGAEIEDALHNTTNEVEDRDAGQLRSELHDRELLLAEADQLAQTDPSPVNLARYREARAMV